MSKLLESVNKRDFDRRISEVVEMLGEKQLYGTISLIKDLKYYLDLATKEKAHTCNCQHNSNSRDNEPCCGCDNRTAKINKARVNSLEIIAHMLNNKPYYELRGMGGQMNSRTISDIEPIKRQCVYEDNKPCNNSCRYSNTCIHSASKTEE